MDLPLELPALLERREALLAGLAITTLLLLWLAGRVRRIAKSDRPDDTVANIAMVIGLGWSAEAVWEITGPDKMNLPLQVRLLLFFVFETLLALAMIRAKRAMRTIGHPGRSGRTAWIVAACMAAVGAAAGTSFGDSLVRFLIPLLITNAWWDGLVGDGTRRKDSATSWRWTPRRLLLWLGAIEPGERDVDSIHRERLTQQMTQLEFRRRHGSDKQKARAATKLARLSLTADDDIVAVVRQRVDRATWFEPTQPATAEAPLKRSVSAGAAASLRARRVRHHRLVRTQRVTHPAKVITAAREPEPDPRTTQEIDDAIRVMKAGAPALAQRRIAHLLRAPEARVRRTLRSVNGRKPDLESAAP
ncbi:hypothetical protein [Actinoplanes sp. NPDC049599]|uniref:hypothetical protein n=1 Tax=Actinoplanes sp. NPDC049599 TaxID=3363903 RepID=UPI0037AE9E77